MNYLALQPSLYSCLSPLILNSASSNKDFSYFSYFSYFTEWTNSEFLRKLLGFIQGIRNELWVVPILASYFGGSFGGSFGLDLPKKYIFIWDLKV